MDLPQPGELVIDSSDAGHVIATFRPLLIAVFTRIPRDEELALLRRRADEAVAAKITGGLLYVVARQDMTGGVDPRVRAVFEEMVKKNEGTSGSSAVVILSTGFAASIVRSAIGGLLIMAQQRKVLRVFGAVEEACDWLAPQYQLQPQALRRAYRNATASLSDLPPG